MWTRVGFCGHNGAETEKSARYFFNPGYVCQWDIISNNMLATGHDLPLLLG
jgi:hypothetical protein